MVKSVEYAKKDIPKLIIFQNKFGEFEKKENFNIKRNNFFSNKLKIKTLKSFKSITQGNLFYDLNAKCLDLNELKLDKNLYPKVKMAQIKNTLNLTENYNLYILNRNIYEIYEDKIDNLARINLKENEINLHFNTISQLKSIEKELDLNKTQIKNSNDSLFFQENQNGIKINFDLNNVNKLLKKNIFFPNSIFKNNDQILIEEEKKERNIIIPIEKESDKKFNKMDLKNIKVIKIISNLIKNY
jgi:hypothetical protein